MDSEDGELFVKQLAIYVRTHEKALANALQLKRQPGPRHGPSQSVSSIQVSSPPTSLPERPSTSSSASGTLAAALSLGNLNFASQSVKSAKLALTPHHLFYLLSRFEELGIDVGPMKVRLENLHDTSTSANYISFLDPSQRTKSRDSDVGSIRSVSSIRSVMSGMSTLWAGFGIGSSISATRNEKQKAAAQADLKYLYSSFTKIPSLRLAPDWRAKLIRGYEEFPFDSAVPLYAFKNLQALEISSIDFRQFFGWDRLAEQLRSLTVKHASIDDPADILIDIVLDDMDKRRRRSSKAQSSPTGPHAHTSSPKPSPTVPHAELYRPTLVPAASDRRATIADLHVVGSMGNESNESTSASSSRRQSLAKFEAEVARSPGKSGRPRSNSPARPASSRHHSMNPRGSHKIRRSGSGSSHSSLSDSWHNPRNSVCNLSSVGILPASKWRFLKHLSLADNALTAVPAASLAPLANTLNSLDLSANLFTQIPDSLATLTALRALNLSHCMIDSLHSLLRNPLPAISALNLRANRLQSLAGIEKLYPLERLDLRDNRLTDPMELARLTGIPDIRELWIEDNPFTRSHRDYRIKIFNLFRQTPGYTEDIIIDASGPTYSEKKYLVERVAVPAAVPVVKPTAPEIHAVEVRKPTIICDEPSKQPAVLYKERRVRPTPKAVASEVNTASTRRRRTPKRRIVDLATNDLATMAPPQPISVEEVAAGVAAASGGFDGDYRISQPAERQELSPLTETRSPDALSPTELPRTGTRVHSVFSQTPAVFPVQEAPGWKDVNFDISGEIYRQKIEALRDTVGNGYLSVLNEEGWDSTRPAFPTEFSSASPLRSSPATPRTPSIGQAIHAGRTLG
ncbi:Uu.00g005680.m01.CDS01 [Anthostomella pinea]|uniref:Uu.00g005680.m01.CDS01 n=1 Tax=Anthostomella pinea TaxID=933095 RepID=A0AAI8YJ20_9PEZI|nr:Uu.00g005680.m01.CDS01 [Anthostomella pinea]